MDLPENFKELPLEERRELIRRKHKEDVPLWLKIVFFPYVLLISLAGPTRNYYVWVLSGVLILTALAYALD